MKLYNTLSNEIELFIPLEDKKVKMYVCGITPYDTTHLGHAFTYMAFDVLQRYLISTGNTVTYVQNVTDIDDDILKKAKQTDQDWKELGNFWTEKFLRDLNALSIQMPTHYVKATEAIPTIITIVKTLLATEYAYENNGNIYFRVEKDREYGKLSQYPKVKMLKLSKGRGANPNDPLKKHPLDFILWQKSLPGEPYWESPWGKGRPGWHIECSAMIYKYLDNNIDIHGGGIDLIYPHHESEIAQSEQFTGVKPFSGFWMHTGAVSYEGEKISKSLGNLIMISDLLKTYSPNTIRYLLLTHHYRKPWEFKEAMLGNAEKKVQHIEELLDSVIADPIRDPGYKRIPYSLDSRLRGNDIVEKFYAALDNDLNTPHALQVWEEAITKKDYNNVKTMSQILGFIF